MATFEFIKRREFGDTLRIAERLFSDKTELTQRAVGAMLYEIAKRNMEVFQDFFKNSKKKIPKLVIETAIERMKEKDRKEILDIFSK